MGERRQAVVVGSSGGIGLVGSGASATRAATHTYLSVNQQHFALIIHSSLLQTPPDTYFFNIQGAAGAVQTAH